LDEADRLLEMGFRPSLEAILRALPPKGPARQSLLFSATVPDDVLAIATTVLKPGYEFVNTVPEEESQTHEHVRISALQFNFINLKTLLQVPQEYVVTPFQSLVPNLVRLIRHQTSAVAGYKIMVFFTTARFTQYMASLWKAMGTPVLEIHSRKSQGQRIAASKAFDTGTNVIMFSSDVSARGMDYEGVTCVIQVGLTDRSQYIHRLGRTARAGKGGCGLLLLADDETCEFDLANLVVDWKSLVTMSHIYSVTERTIPPTTKTRWF
jgi:ATP-dependent RNA helicase MSS116